MEYLPLQFCAMIFAGILTILIFTFIDLTVIPPDTVGSKVFYGLWVCSIYFFFPGCYSVFAPATKDIFGLEYFAANYGLIFSQNVLTGKRFKCFPLLKDPVF